MKLSAATAAITIALLSATIASAAGPAVSWSVKDMKTAVRGLGYPKPHAKKLVCRGLGTAAGGQFDSFRCVATYTHHKRRVFYTAGRGEGGWLCAGKTATACGLLRHGFLTTAAASVYPSLAGAAGVSAEGWLADHGKSPFQVVHFCEATTPTTFSCPFTVNNVTVTVTIGLKKTTGGYVVSGSAS